ncbi:MAG: GSCFA domain-containing protein [Muribaculaceae bacterium]|nr:GSCFA domain-containing protein [Muribaculaceae bacterium]
MRFRTEIEPATGSFEISADTPVALVGSCFADEIGRLLARDGVPATAGIMGPLFNPLSIKKFLDRNGRPYTPGDLTLHEGVWHCLDWANRYQHTDPDTLLESVNADFSRLSEALTSAQCIIITFGNTKVYETPLGIAGNCHKLPAGMFASRRLTLEEIVDAWTGIDFGHRNVILTLSPVRYTENGLAESTLAKATLRVAIDRICSRNGWDYFPAFEILNDDLRDYRFYASDLKHPSDTAIEYVYQHFCETYMSRATRETLKEHRKASLTAAHHPILHS